MITSQTHTKGWLQDIGKKFKGKDPAIVERIIKALTLLEQLIDSGLKDFVFKGGTSLILLLQKTARFSVDIDLCVKSRPRDLEEIFNKVIQAGVFTSWEKSERKPRPPLQKEHYKFNFLTVDKEKESAILLDLVFQDFHYPKLEKRPIVVEFLDVVAPIVEVQVLPIDCMLGDKLTAFAPDTCGVPYGINKELEIIKQLFDVSRLFLESKDLRLVRETFVKSAEIELKHRDMKGRNFSDVLEDIFQTSLMIAVRGRDRDPDKFAEIARGIKGFASFVTKGKFSIENAILCSSHAAYLSQLIRKEDALNIERFDSRIDLAEVLIKGKFNYLNKLKKSSPESFFYFKKAVEIYEDSDID